VNAEVQKASTLQGMRIFMIVIPMVGLLLSILMFRKKYKLTEERMGEILTELKGREGDK
jgi:melibiose permease